MSWQILLAYFVGWTVGSVLEYQHHTYGGTEWQVDLALAVLATLILILLSRKKA